MRLSRALWIAAPILLLCDLAWAGGGEQTAAPKGGDGGWTNPDSVFVSDDQRANDNAVDSLFATDFEFSIPGDSAIDSLEVYVEGYNLDATEARRGLQVQFTKDGATGVGSINTKTMPFLVGGEDTIAWLNYGLWETTFTPAEINASTFGVICKNETDHPQTWGYIDYIQIKVYFSTGEAAGEAVGRRSRIIKSE